MTLQRPDPAFWIRNMLLVGQSTLLCIKVVSKCKRSADVSVTTAVSVTNN